MPTVFHTDAWTRVLTETYGYRALHLTAGSTGSPTGMLPLMEVDSWLTGRRGISLPFTDACPILAETPEVAKALWHQALDLGRTRGWKYLELRDGPDWLKDEPASTTFYHHTLDLRAPEARVAGVADPGSARVAGVADPGVAGVADPGSTPERPGSNRQASDSKANSGVSDPSYNNPLFSRLDSAVRRAIRKAQQTGLTVEITQSVDAMRDFFGLMQLTRKRHGLPPQPYGFFASIHRHLIAAGNGCIVLAKQGAKAIAGAVYLHHGTQALYKFGASDERHQQLRGNNLVMWEAIQWHRQRGFTALDFGRTSLHNDGLRRFKLGWGTTETQVRYHRFSYRTNAYTTSPDRSTGLHAYLFRHLPRPLSRLAGELLYRHIA